MTWSRRFEDPIALPNGKNLITLREAGSYIAALPKAKQQLPHWQAATEALLMAAHGRGPLLHARVGILRALNHDKPPPDIPQRKKRAKAYRIVR